MSSDSFTTGHRPLRRYLIASLVGHALLFGLIIFLIQSEQRRVAGQEEQFIGGVAAEELRQERQERVAQQEAVKEMLGDQVQAEMDALIADELEPPDEQDLSQMTHQEIENRVEEIEKRADEPGDQGDQSEWKDLTNEQFYEMLTNLSSETFAGMRTNLRQMKRDLLLAQVRSYIRRKVAPEITRGVELKLKNELGRRIEQEARKQSGREKGERLGRADAELQEAIKELGALKLRQDATRSDVQRKRFAQASRRESDIEAAHPANAERINAALERVRKASPELAGQAASLQGAEPERRIAPEITRASAAIGTAGRADSEFKAQDAAAKKLRKDRQAREKNPEALKIAETGRARADQVARQEKARAEARAQVVSAKMAERIKSLQTLSQKIKEQSRQAGADAVQKQVVGAALDQVRDAVRKKVEKEVHDTAIPIAAQRIVVALKKDLVQRKLDTQEFRKFLEADIRRALAEETGRLKPDTELAMQRTRKRFELQDRQSLDAARKEVAEIAAKLRALAAGEEKLRDKATGPTAPADAGRQRELGGRIRQAQAVATEVLKRARRATLLHDRRVTLAEAEVGRPTAREAAEEAGRALDRQAVPQARDLMAEAAGALKKSAESLDQLAADLGAEAAAVRQVAHQEIDLEKALGPEQADKAVADVRKAADKVVQERIKPAVEQVARGVGLKNILAGADRAEALQRMDALEEKLDQVAANMAEGRGLGEALGMDLPGAGLGGGRGGGEKLPWTLPNRRSMSRFNRQVYEEFVKDMRKRLNPDNYYGKPEAAEGLDSVARAGGEPGAAVIFVEALPEKKTAGDKNRKVPPPDFPYLAFGAAQMMEKSVVIDGDLSDWGRLRHGLKMQYNIRSETVKIVDGPTVYVRWSPEGLYFGYTVKDTNGIQPCKDHSWSGDCLEVMIDTANSRLPRAYKNMYSQKFSFTPFGCRGSQAVKVWEMGRGLRGLRMAGDYPDTKGIMGRTAAKIIPGYGYSVECFLSRRALVKPRLVPGRYIAMNFSVNQGYSSDDSTQWSASQKLQTWRRPDTWGDLLLLGSDAKLKFVAADPGSRDGGEVRGVVPNDPLGLEIADADMNVNMLQIDRLAAEVVSKKTGASLLVVLRETGPSSGLFRGSVNTQPYFLPPRKNTLNVRGGDTVQLLYTDARAEYGEKNLKRKAELAVGWPVMKLGGN